MKKRKYTRFRTANTSYLATALRIIRTCNDVSQLSLGERGVSLTRISFCETGKKEPDREVLALYSNEFDIPVDIIRAFAEALRRSGDRRKDVVRKVIENYTKLA